MADTGPLCRRHPRPLPLGGCSPLFAPLDIEEESIVRIFDRVSKAKASDHDPLDLVHGRQSALGLPAHDKSVKLLENGAKVDVRIHRDPAGFTVAPPGSQIQYADVWIRSKCGKSSGCLTSTTSQPASRALAMPAAESSKAIARVTPSLSMAVR